MSDGEDTPTPAFSEQAVIGAVLISGGEALDELTLKPEDFLGLVYEQAYAVALELRAAGRVVDQFTVADALPAATLKEPIFEAASVVFTWANVGYYADFVAAAALRRRVARAGQAITELSTESDHHGLVDEARSMLDRIVGSRVEAAVPTMREVYDEWQAQMAETIDLIPTPWADLSAKLGGGMAGSRFYVIGARPGIGKSAIALQLASELGQRGRVLFASLEMPRNEVIARIVAQQNRVPFKNVLTNTLSDFMVERINTWRAVDPMNVAVDDDAALSVFDIRNRARSMARQGNLAGVVIDYIQLMQDPRDLPRHEKVAEMTRSLKLLSRELDIPVIACSQLNRESQRRADQTPNLSDLRESGAIEQDADVVILLDRNVAEGAEDDELAMILAKNRQGAPGSVYLQWQGEFVRAMSFR